MFEISVESHFSAAHYLRHYQGKCSLPHGHNWTVEARFQCRDLDGLGMGVDFQTLKGAIEEIFEELDHSDLNRHPAFMEENPTAENIARYIFRGLRAKVEGERVRLSRVIVCESPGCSASYWE